ncbi:scarecrow-like protein 6 [Sesamum indicum]|uniref:Scarecrow-like protein 6 n=1 Tax=Sesamum indicum TaxID=4182 RepID=A0A6I9TYT2_SESIN|nr:scarecrow-like protein 6 [Sesamum indicum]
MKGMPLPFDFEGKGVLDLELIVKNKSFIADSSAAVSSYFSKKNCFLNNSFGEPTSVLDSARISSRPTSSSTLSSSHGGGGGSTGGGGGAASTDTAGVAAVSDTNPSPKWQQDSTTATSSNAGGANSELLPIPPSLEIGTAGGGSGGNGEKFAMEDWESVLSESVAVSPSQEQSILRWIMGDVEDPAMGSLNKVLQIGGGAGGVSAAAEFEFSGGFGVGDQGFGGDQYGTAFMPTVPSFPNNNRSSAEKIGLASNPISSNLPTNFKFPPNSQNITHPSSLSNNLDAIALHHQNSFDSSAEMRPPIFNSQLLINQQQTQQAQNPSFFFPLSYAQQQEQNLLMPPQAKRHNSGGPVSGGLEPGSQISKGSFADTAEQELFMGRQQLHLQQQPLPHQLHLLPHYMQQRPMGPGQKPKIGGGDELGHCHQQQQQQQAIVDQLYKAAELVQTGNPVLAQGILARLNHQLSPIGKPFHRAAFYCKEALQLLLHTNNNNVNPSTASSSPFSLIFKIGAYKSFSEISPLIQFANFTCNQALLEVLEGFDRIHIVDFDIGFGGQWASLMQELALRSGGAPSLKITALASPSTHDQLELGLTRENLIQFASEINIAFEFEAMSIDSLDSGSWSLPFHASENEAVAVNLPIVSLANCQLSVPLVLRFVKQLSPRIVVSVDRGCDRTDLPFANHIIHALHSHSNLLESLDAVNVNMDSLQKIERFLLQPGIEKIVMGRFHSPEKTQHWRSLFLSSGFSPVTFSNFTESQAECVVKRTPVRGFQVEKRQSSLVLCWQRKELISASAWRC